MQRPFSFHPLKILTALLLALLTAAPTAWAQDKPAKDEEKAPPPAKKRRPDVKLEQLGVLRVIPPNFDPQTAIAGPRPIHEIIEGIPARDWTPKTQPKTKTLHWRAREATFRHPLWNLEFSFKPLRMVRVNVPTADGGVEQKLVWYMVYRLRDTQKYLVPKQEQSPTGNTVYRLTESDSIADYLRESGAGDEQSGFPFWPIRFIPRFRLELHPKEIVKRDAMEKLAEERRKRLRAKGVEVADPEPEKLKRIYADQIVPAAIDKIQRREDPGIKLLDTVQISRYPNTRWVADPDKNWFPRRDHGWDEHTIWGVVMWTDVDPKIDYFSIYIRGLTNQRRWLKDEQDPRKFEFKELKLNFYRPGDQFFETEDEIQLGIPGEVDYEWVYR